MVKYVNIFFLGGGYENFHTLSPSLSNAIAMGVAPLLFHRGVNHRAAALIVSLNHTELVLRERSASQIDINQLKPEEFWLPFYLRWLSLPHCGDSVQIVRKYWVDFCLETKNDIDIVLDLFKAEDNDSGSLPTLEDSSIGNKFSFDSTISLSAYLLDVNDVSHCPHWTCTEDELLFNDSNASEAQEIQEKNDGIFAMKVGGHVDDKLVQRIRFLANKHCCPKLDDTPNLYPAIPSSLANRIQYQLTDCMHWPTMQASSALVLSEFAVFVMKVGISINSGKNLKPKRGRRHSTKQKDANQLEVESTQDQLGTDKKHACIQEAQKFANEIAKTLLLSGSCDVTRATKNLVMACGPALKRLAKASPMVILPPVIESISEMKHLKEGDLIVITEVKSTDFLSLLFSFSLFFSLPLSHI